MRARTSEVNCLEFFCFLSFFNSEHKSFFANRDQNFFHSAFSKKLELHFGYFEKEISSYNAPQNLYS